MHFLLSPVVSRNLLMQMLMLSQERKTSHFTYTMEKRSLFKSPKHRLKRLKLLMKRSKVTMRMKKNKSHRGPNHLNSWKKKRRLYLRNMKANMTTWRSSIHYLLCTLLRSGRSLRQRSAVSWTLNTSIGWVASLQLIKMDIIWTS